MIRRTILAASVLALLPMGAHGAALDLDALWPNTDGLAWTFAQRHEVLRPDPATTDRTVRLIFQGTSTAAGGVAVQVLGGDARPPVLAAEAADPLAHDPFLRTLAIARPDLRAAVLAKQAGGPCPADAIPGFAAVLLSAPYAWRKDAGEIAAWRCDLAGTRAWKWLESDLTIGHTFDLQLVPDLASNVFLHVTNGPLEDVTVPAGTYAGAQRVDYVVDYGASNCTDTGGTPVGTYRAETRGSVWYAPGVGPVKSTEEFVPYLLVTGTCTPPIEIGQPSVRTTLQLASAPVPARAGTWGAIKIRWR